mmetsp:Transcript_6376/g.10088  ORF Transcript_6376/g.10088 Transcript_6376/m.10088 type:complete len:226 (-) Transcript_6376:101-778(-)
MSIPMLPTATTLESTWQAHRQRFAELKASFKRSCDAITRIDNVSEREQVIQSAKQKMHEIEDTLQRMKSDLRCVPPQHAASKALFQREWHSMSEEYGTLRDAYKRGAVKHQWLSMEPHTKLERQHLLHQSEIYDHMKARSMQSLLALSQSETIGVHVSQTLHSQGQQLDKIHSDIHDVNAVSDRAHRLVKSMKTKVYTDRFLQTLIVIVELVIIVFLLWWKLRKD